MADPGRKRGDLDLFKCADLGLRLAAAVGLGAFGGYKLDQWLAIGPFGLIGGCMLGLALGMTHVIMTVSALTAGKSGKAGKAGKDEPS